jgi:hypothetical protein
MTRHSCQWKPLAPFGLASLARRQAGTFDPFVAAVERPQFAHSGHYLLTRRTHEALENREERSLNDQGLAATAIMAKTTAGHHSELRNPTASLVKSGPIHHT